MSGAPWPALRKWSLRAARFSRGGPERSAAAQLLPSALLVCFASSILSGCADFGHVELARDHLGYSQSLTDSQKEETLVNIVRLRYGNVPVFLNPTQVIAGYQLQRNASIGAQFFPSATLSTFALGSAGMQLQQSPTFTFQPVNGKDYTESYVRPLSPAGIYPLTVGNLPIDVLFRLTVTSIGRHRNINVFAGKDDRSSESFFKVLAGLRALQLAGSLEMKLAAEDGGKGPKGTITGDDLVLFFRPPRTPNEMHLQRELKTLLDLPADIREAKLVYGSAAGGPGEIPIVTRSVLGILAAVAYDVAVPPSDVDNGFTLPSITSAVAGRLPEIVIRSSDERPEASYAAIPYRGHWFSISDADMNSKIAFAVLQLLISLAQTPQASGTIVTVPAR